MKRKFFIFLSIIALTLSACVPATEVETKAPPSELQSTASPSTVLQPTNTPQYLSPLYKTHIFIGGEGWATNLDNTKIYNTVNFGEYWFNVTPDDINSSFGYSQNSVSFPNGHSAWLCETTGESSAILKISTDAGKNWSYTQLEFPCGLIDFSNSEDGMIMSDLGAGAGSQYVSVHTTNDGGLTWTKTFEHEPASSDNHGLPASGIKSSLLTLNGGIALIGGSRPMPDSLYLFRTTDSGENWNQVSCDGLPSSEDAELNPLDLVKISNQEIILPIRAFQADNEIQTHICLSTDAGESFNYLSSLGDVKFVDFGRLENGLAYADNKMMQTSDGGLTWVDKTEWLPVGVIPIGLNMINATIGYLNTTINEETLDQNRIFMTANNGNTWQSMPGTIVD